MSKTDYCFISKCLLFFCFDLHIMANITDFFDEHGIEDRYRSVLIETVANEADYLVDIEPEDLKGKACSWGIPITAPVARGLVRKLRGTPPPTASFGSSSRYSFSVSGRQDVSKKMMVSMDSIRSESFNLANYRKQRFRPDYVAPQWPTIKKSADFEEKFTKALKDHLSLDKNPDSMSGSDLASFMDELTNLLVETYGNWKTYEEIRLAVQYGLDQDFDGLITEEDAMEFLEKLRTENEEMVNVPITRDVPKPRPTSVNAFFETGMKRLWSKHDTDRSGCIDGEECKAFLDDVTDLHVKAYGESKPKEQLRSAIQADLDNNINGTITRTEAEAFMFRRAAGTALPEGK